MTAPRPIPNRNFESLFPAVGASKHTRIPAYMHRVTPDRTLLAGAKCRPVDALHFEARTRGDSASERTSNGEQGIKDQAARKVCNGTPSCPVRARCLLWALQSGTTGVAGGVVVTQATVLQYKKARKTAVTRKAQNVHERLRRANAQAG